MPMTVVVTRNAEGRVRGFLASCMLEVASGVYVSPSMTKAVRDRMWAVLEMWCVGARNDGAVLIWPDAASPGGQAIRNLGEPPLELRETSSVVLSRRELTEAELRSLITLVDGTPF